MKEPGPGKSYLLYYSSSISVGGCYFVYLAIMVPTTCLDEHMVIERSVGECWREAPLLECVYLLLTQEGLLSYLLDLSLIEIWQ